MASVSPFGGTVAACERPALERTDRCRVALDLVGVALIALYVGMFAIRYTPMQSDFRTYVTAARTALEEIDPYPPEHLTALARRPTLPFVYPPITLLVFVPLVALPHRLAHELLMGANVALLAGLVVAWRRWLGTRIGLLPLVLAAVFGWNSSALWCFRSGNMALIEAAMIWGALVCFTRGRRMVFAGLVVTAACFKLMPAAFLLLLLVPTEQNAPSPAGLLASLAVLAALVVGPVACGPAAHWEFFMRHLPPAETMGSSNPGALGFVTCLVQSWGVSEAHARPAGLGAWVALVIALIAISTPFLRAALRARDACLVAMAALFLYLLMEPRPMAYGFVLLTPAVLYFSPRPFDGPTSRLALSLVLAVQGLTTASKHSSDSVVYTYAPFLLALCIWLLIVSSALGSTSRLRYVDRP